MTDISELISKLNYWCGWSMLTEGGWYDVKADLAKAADALARLTTQPLPEEIAGLIERLGKIDEAPFSVNDCYAVREATAAIRALGQENEELTKAVNGFIEAEKRLIKRDAERLERISALVQENAKLKAIAIEIEEESHQHFQELEAELGGLNIRIRELEAERDKFLESDEVGKLIHDHVISACRAKEAEFSRERDAIQAKTIEECAKICEPIEGEHFPPSWDVAAIERQHATRRWCAAAIRALGQTDEGKTETGK